MLNIVEVDVATDVHATGDQRAVPLRLLRISQVGGRKRSGIHLAADVGWEVGPCAATKHAQAGHVRPASVEQLLRSFLLAALRGAV